MRITDYLFEIAVHEDGSANVPFPSFFCPAQVSTLYRSLHGCGSFTIAYESSMLLGMTGLMKGEKLYFFTASVLRDKEFSTLIG